MDLHLDRPNATLAYSSTGPADAEHTVVAAHSLATSRAWEDQTGLFDWNAITEAGNRVTRFDTRGHGDSTGTADDDQYSWPVLAEDYIAIADATSPDGPVDGIGQSTGCGVLLWAAATRPERFRRLVLVIPPTRGAAREEQAQLYLAASQMIELRGIDAWQRLVAVTPPAPILASGGWHRPTWIAVQEGLVPSVLRGAARSVLPSDDELRRIDQPTLIFTWDADPSHPLDSAEYLADRIPDSILEVATVPDHVRSWGRRAASFLEV